MELELVRRYYAEGTNGDLYMDGVLQCFTIELPWLNNQRRISCIPEGRYRLEKRYSPKFKLHIEVLDVKGRSGILIHPANDALKELKGCIAPVSQLTGAGRGTQSRLALEWVKGVVYPELERCGDVFLRIWS
ncbi:MAG: DUF5675 family protein [Flavisolibacter sp.]